MDNKQIDLISSPTRVQPCESIMLTFLFCVLAGTSTLHDLSINDRDIDK